MFTPHYKYFINMNKINKQLCVSVNFAYVSWSILKFRRKLIIKSQLGIIQK